MSPSRSCPRPQSAWPPSPHSVRSKHARGHLFVRCGGAHTLGLPAAPGALSLSRGRLCARGPALVFSAVRISAAFLVPSPSCRGDGMRFPLLVTCEGVRTWPLWCRCRLQVALQGVRQVVSETWWGVTGLPADVPSPRPRGPPYSGCRVVPGHSADLRPRPPPSGAQTSECGRHHPVALERRDLGWPSVHPRGGIVSASRPPGSCACSERPLTLGGAHSTRPAEPHLRTARELGANRGAWCGGQDRGEHSLRGTPRLPPLH